MTRLGVQRECCDTVTGDDHRSCPETGHNAAGVAMCACKPYGRVHAWEPGEWCGNRVIPAGEVSR